MRTMPQMDNQHRVGPLTRNERLVFGALKGAGAPLKAYDVLDRLKQEGVRAPMTVYRALDGLCGKGLVHKIDALNAFTPCNRPAPHLGQMFLICENCEMVEELAELDSALDLNALADSRGFDVRSARLEVQGLCSHCSDSSAQAPAAE
ncbi:MAG: transcriptional repressor [Pseudomonadota bacterium]